MKAAGGIVKIHAHTMRPAIPHRTAESRPVAPTPTIAPVIVCVVDTGIPRWVARKRDPAAAVSAENPPTGFSFVIFVPSVFTIRHPPASVSAASAARALRPTPLGIGRALPGLRRYPA